MSKPEFEVSRVHFIFTDEIERCEDPACNSSHVCSVYLKAPDGRSEWLSDHLTDELAKVAAVAYEPLFQYEPQHCVTCNLEVGIPERPVCCDDGNTTRLDGSLEHRDPRCQACCQPHHGKLSHYQKNPYQ